MAILNMGAVSDIERKISEMTKTGVVPYGYPLGEVRDLIDTVMAMRARKKKYQHLAEQRGQAIANVFSTASRAIDRLE